MVKSILIYVHAPNRESLPLSSLYSPAEVSRTKVAKSKQDKKKALFTPADKQTIPQKSIFNSLHLNGHTVISFTGSKLKLKPYHLSQC